MRRWHRHLLPVPPFRVRQRKARRMARQLILWLPKKGKTAAAIVLAAKLQGCRQSDRCGSAACPVCATAAQENYAKALRAMISTKPSDGTVFTLTLVTEAEMKAVGDLSSYDPLNHKRRLRRQLAELGISWAAGGVDISLNEHQQQRYVPFWMPHVYLMGVTTDIEALRKQLRGLFPATDRIPRPALLNVFKGGRRASLYALKPDFNRRVGKDDDVRTVRRTGALRLCRATSKQRLRSAERLELRLFLDGLTIPARFITLRCQVHQCQQSYSIRLAP